MPASSEQFKINVCILNDLRQVFFHIVQENCTLKMHMYESIRPVASENRAVYFLCNWVVRVDLKPFFEGGHPIVHHQIYIVLVASIHNACKDQVFYYNLVIPGDMFRPLNGHPQTNLEYYC